MSIKFNATISSIIILLLFINTTSNAQCTIDQHANNRKESWLSCQKSSNPNLARGESHWLQLDLGYLYDLGETKFWNYNVANQTENGFKDVVLDYSIDGIHWTEAGSFQLPEATGGTNENGIDGLDLTGISAKYILITALSNWSNSNCTGISEVKIEIGSPQTTFIKSRQPTNHLNTEQSSIHLYPNPTSHILNVAVHKEVKAFIISNVAGNEIMRHEGNQTTLQLDVSNLPSGMYMLQILTKEMQIISKRFIKSGL